MILAALALAQASTCAATDRDLPSHLSAWQSPVSAGAEIEPGRSVFASPASPLSLNITEAGTYGVAIDTGAWIDVVRGDEVFTSSAHGHGPACSTIRKIVSFRLEPGRYTIRMNRTDAMRVRLLVIRQP